MEPFDERMAEPAPAPAAPLTRPIGHPLVRSILFLIAFLLIQAGAGLFFYLTAAATGTQASDPTGLIYQIVFALTAPPLVLLTIAFVRYLDRRELASIGARWPDGGKGRALRQLFTVSAATLLLIVAWVALVSPFAELAYGGLSEAFRTGPSWLPGPAGSVVLLAILLLGFVIQGGVEEWIMRGYIYRALKERWSWWVSALVSSVLFSALHALNPSISWVALLNIVLAGVVLAELVERSGSLWSATIAHGVWNFAIACLLSLPISGVPFFKTLSLSIAGPELLTGGAFGPEGSLLLTAMALVLIALLWPRARATSAG